LSHGAVRCYDENEALVDCMSRHVLGADAETGKTEAVGDPA